MTSESLARRAFQRSEKHLKALKALKANLHHENCPRPLAKLMSFQKQKHPIAKFLQHQIKQKQFFRGGTIELSLLRS